MSEQNEMRWIRTKEQVPPKGEAVLGAYNEGRDKWRYIEMRRGTVLSENEWTSGADVFFAPQYWMRVSPPEPPETQAEREARLRVELEAERAAAMAHLAHIDQRLSRVAP